MIGAHRSRSKANGRNEKHSRRSRAGPMASGEVCLQMSAAPDAQGTRSTHTSPSARSEAAQRPARILHVPHLRSCCSWPPAVGHKRLREGLGVRFPWGYSTIDGAFEIIRTLHSRLTCHKHTTGERDDYKSGKARQG